MYVHAHNLSEELWLHSATTCTHDITSFISSKPQISVDHILYKRVTEKMPIGVAQDTYIHCKQIIFCIIYFV